MPWRAQFERFLNPSVGKLWAKENRPYPHSEEMLVRPVFWCAQWCLVSGHRERVSRDIVNDVVVTGGMSQDIVNGEQIRAADQSRHGPGTLPRASRPTARGIKDAGPQAPPPMAH